MFELHLVPSGTFYISVHAVSPSCVTVTVMLMIQSYVSSDTVILVYRMTITSDTVTLVYRMTGTSDTVILVI